MEFGVLLRFVGVMNFILILSRPFIIQGREPYLSDFVTKDNKEEKEEEETVGFYSDIYRLISFKLSMMIESTKF